MKFKRLALQVPLGLALLISLCGSIVAENLKTAPNLDASFNLTKDPSNKRVFEEQMSGGDNNQWVKRGRLDKNDPNYKVIWDALKDTTRINHPLDTFYLGLSTLPDSKEDYLGWIFWDRYYAPYAPVVEPKLALGIFTFNPSDRSLKLNPKIKPMTSLVLGDAEGFLDFDWAKYDLGPMGRAIGVRTYRGACGAGGSLCSNELLRLFTIQEPEIKEVFISRVGFYGNYGGEWNKDGTRQHIIQELNGIVVLHPSALGAPPSITVKARLKKRWLKREFKWAKRADGSEHYETKDKEIFPQVHLYESLFDPSWSK